MLVTHGADAADTEGIATACASASRFLRDILMRREQQHLINR